MSHLCTNPGNNIRVDMTQTVRWDAEALDWVVEDLPDDKENTEA